MEDPERYYWIIGYWIVGLCCLWEFRNFRHKSFIKINRIYILVGYLLMTLLLAYLGTLRIIIEGFIEPVNGFDRLMSYIWSVELLSITFAIGVFINFVVYLRAIAKYDKRHKSVIQPNI